MRSGDGIRGQAALLGRESEWDAVARFIDAIPSGPAALLLAGPSGIGKTALWRLAAAEAASHGLRVLSASAVPAESQLSFAGLSDLLDVDLDSIPALPDPQRRALDLALLRADGPPIDPRAVSLAMLGVLRAMAEAEPLVVAIDDAQWLDPPSARVLDFSLRRLTIERIGLLFAQRTDEGAIDLSIPLLSSDPEYTMERLALAPLDVESIGLMIRHRLGFGLTLPVLRQIHETSGGNPMYALEIAGAIARQGMRRTSGLTIPIPDDLRLLVRERLALLPPNGSDVLLTIAAMGQPTMVSVSAAVGDPSRTASAVVAAVEAGILELEGDLLRFTHPLVSSVVYSDVPRASRRPLHRRLASIVDDVEERARHLAMSAEATDEELAVALDQASERAHARGAPEIAADLAERSIHATPATATGALRRRLLSAGTYHLAAGDLPRARAHVEHAIERSAPGRERALAIRRLAWITCQTEGWTAGARLFDQAEREGTQDPALLPLIHRDLALAGLMAGEPASAHRLAAIALVEASETDETLGAETLALAATAQFLAGGGIDDAALDRSVRQERCGSHDSILLCPRWMLAGILLWSDDLARARSVLTELFEETLERGDEASLPAIRSRLSEIETRSGRPDLGRAHADPAMESALETGQEVARGLALCARALAEALAGDVAGARSDAAEGLVLAGSSGDALLSRQIHAVLGSLELSLNDPAAAWTSWEPLARGLERGRVGDPSVTRLLPDAIEAALSVGHRARAAELLDRFEERANTLNEPVWISNAARCRALLLAAEDRSELALAEFQRAVELAELADRPIELGRALLHQGVAMRRAKQKRAARHALARAKGVFDDIGAAPWSTRVTAELARIGGRVARPGDLTPTERTVAELVSEGLTNREVAQALFLSVRTVEGTLSRAYHKLGVRSRTELAMALPKERSAP